MKTPPAHAAELTLRGLLLGAVITVVFMTANLYMGLKTGVTFSTSIPAAMLSMGVLRLVGNANIFENNIVQTQASAAGTLCNVILVLPGLVLIGHWSDFPYWQTTGLCLIGGLLGIAYSIPLRRALVMGAGLPYPEGTAAAEVLRAGDSSGDAAPRGGLRPLLGAAALAGLVGLSTTGFRVLADGMHATVAAGSALFRFGTGFSLALVGVGYLVGLGACLALLTGVAIAWGVAVPVLTALGSASGEGADAAARAVWSDQVRLIGAGIIAVGALWTVASLARQIAGSMKAAFASARTGGAEIPRQERDLPITWVAGATLGLAALLAGLFWIFASGADLGALHIAVVAVATVFAVLFGFLMAAACGYLAGLLGSSSSPISGIGILTTLVTALLIPLLIGRSAGPEGDRFVIGLALLLAAVVVTTASIANDNLQDLKTGQLVDATPWRQQVALMAGVTVGALVIAPLLSLLYQAYGFAQALPRPGMDPGNALPAPQAALMTQIASGIVHGELPWTMVLVGAALGVVFVVIETLLRRRELSFPALTVGIGIYLPLEVVVTIAVGGVIGWLARRRLRAGPGSDEAEPLARRRGVLIASGFLVGESIVGVLLAAADTLSGRSSSLVLVGPDFAPVATGLGAVVFAAIVLGFQHLVSRAPPA
ncbi:oligopeptide transporter, OPT family [Methylobacterium sp. 37f]|uniref:OPT family oligopeptide transporter n=1 Tax=Methylobacterium sp. 37f TaxID=2817058 RepID=UPI001FFD4502|nr:oligopeptide transporter, OPT family [Methylobacterium sp. 37f]